MSNDGEPGLFEPTEGRGPPAPPGALFIGGADVSSVRLSIAVDGPLQAVFTKSFTRPRFKDLGNRLDIVYLETVEFARSVHARYPMEQIAVEAPGMNPGQGGAEPVLEFATGVVVAGLSSALGGRPVWMMPVARWKKYAVGHGHAKKPQILEWAGAEFGARIEDEADASGVARAARLIVWGAGDGFGPLADEKDVKRGALPRG